MPGYSTRYRVALVLDESLDRNGGAGHYVRTLALELRRMGHTVTHLVGESDISNVDGSPVVSLARNVPVRFNGTCGSMPLVTRSSQLRGALDAGAFDVVHVQVPFSPLLAGRLIAKLPPTTALVGTFHGCSERTLARVGARMHGVALRSFLPRFDALLAVSETAATSAQRFFGLTNCAIIPSPVNLSLYRGRPQRDRSVRAVPQVVFVGALVERKGVKALVKATRLICAAGHEIEVLIAGSGPLARTLERDAQRLPIRVLGSVTEAEKIDLLSAADLACFPAMHGESLGVVLLEAMAAGVPILAGDTPGYVETLGGVGALCAPHPRSLASGILELLADDRRRQTIRVAQRQRVQRFSSERIVEEIVTAYGRAVAAKRGPASPNPVTAV